MASGEAWEFGKPRSRGRPCGPDSFPSLTNMADVFCFLLSFFFFLYVCVCVLFQGSCPLFGRSFKGSQKEHHLGGSPRKKGQNSIWGFAHGTDSELPMWVNPHMQVLMKGGQVVPIFEARLKIRGPPELDSLLASLTKGHRASRYFYSSREVFFFFFFFFLSFPS